MRNSLLIAVLVLFGSFCAFSTISAAPGAYAKHGMKEGLKNGHKRGLRQGLKDGPKHGLKYGLKDGLKNGLKQGMKNGEKRSSEYQSNTEGNSSEFKENQRHYQRPFEAGARDHADSDRQLRRGKYSHRNRPEGNGVTESSDEVIEATED